MIKYFRWLLILAGSIFVIGLLYRAAFSWGFWAHKEINRQAIESLPTPPKDFFSANAAYIIEHSIEPDQRRSNDKSEQFYHYLDIDRYGTYPFSELPRQYDTAVKKYGVDSVRKNGLLPWRIVEMTEKLSEAMKVRKKEDILLYASDLGHYIADAHVPLHATENYDGQFSGQLGIHSRFESRLPEMYGKDYHFSSGSAEYLGKPLERAFQIILTSYTMVDSVLKADIDVRAGLSEREAFTVVKKNGKTEYQHSDTYYKHFSNRLNGLVEKRMNDAIRSVADFWYTAWVNAGKPNLPN